jgi:transposase-like protein
MKSKEREEARLLRSGGCSVCEIAEKVGVSKGTVSLWVRDIQLTEEQQAILLSRNPAFNGQMKGAKVRKENAFTIRKEWQAEGRKMAESKDPHFIAGCMLYWAEGSKSRNVVSLANTDIDMLRFFVGFLRRWFGMKDEEFGLKVQWYTNSGNTTEGVQKYWTDALDLPIGCVRKFQTDVVSKYSQKKKGNKHPFGTCSVSVCRTDVLQKIYGAIQEFAGFENRVWIS